METKQQVESGSTYHGRKEFRSTKWRMSWNIALLALAAIVAVVYVRTYPLGWVSIFFIGFLIQGFLGVLEAITDYVILDDNKMEIRKTFRRTSIIRDDIESVTWEKGSGTSVRLKDGKWEKIPNLGNDPQGLANSLRSWSRVTGTE